MSNPEAAAVFFLRMISSQLPGKPFNSTKSDRSEQGQEKCIPLKSWCGSKSGKVFLCDYHSEGEFHSTLVKQYMCQLLRLWAQELQR